MNKRLDVGGESMGRSWVRPAVLFGFLGFLSWAGLRHQQLGGGPAGAPPVDALCPLGGLEGLHRLVAQGEWLRRLAPSSLILLGAVLVLTLAFGRVFCGWICPLGALGEGMAALGRRLGIRPLRVPPEVDRPLRWLKGAVLVGITLWAWRTGTLAWRDFDPWVAWMHLSAGWEGVTERPWAYGILVGAVLLASLKVERFWCRYLCPLGALLVPFQRLAWWKVARTPGRCIRCGACDRACPVGLEPLGTERVLSGECLACGRCVCACPAPGALAFTGVQGRTLSPLRLGLAGVGLFLLVWAGARATGVWATFAPPRQESVQTSPGEGIYGWMTLEEVSRSLGIPAERLILLGGLDPGVSRDVPLKKLPGVDDEAFRARVAAALAGTPEGDRKSPPPNPDEVRGTQTLREVATLFGVEEEALLAEAGWPSGVSSDVPLKDLAVSLGAEVQAIREALKRLVP